MAYICRYGIRSMVSLKAGNSKGSDQKGEVLLTGLRCVAGFRSALALPC